jgi:purine-cytosine permease-like protein
VSALADTISNEVFVGNGKIYSTIAGVVLILAILVALFGYPVLIWTAVLATWLVLALLVVLSAGDMLERRFWPAAPSERMPRAKT